MKKQELSLIAALLLLLTILMIPMVSYADTATEQDSATTTYPATTTLTEIGCNSTPATTVTTDTTWYDCISTTTWPPTTTTTIILTGPDGTTNTTTPTTDACGSCVDLLSTAEIVTSEKISVLAYPDGGNWLSADCYSRNGETLSIRPVNESVLNVNYSRYLHFTVRANVPFSVTINNLDESAAFIAAEMNQEDTIITEGGYAVVLDLKSLFTAAYGQCPTSITIYTVDITLYDAGSITVGHLAMTNQSFCLEEIPRIQTTTIPSFPFWDETTTTDTTTTTTLVLTGPDGTTNSTFPPPTTNPTVGDALLPGDANNDGMISTEDARDILRYTIASDLASIRVDFADYNGDGVVNTIDARLILMLLISE